MIKRIGILVPTVFCMAFMAVLAASAQVPDWATGQFTARNPNTGGTIDLTINDNGNVTAVIDGAVYYGTYRNQRLTMNGATSRVQRTSNGIRTTRTDNRERIDYVRGTTGWNGGNQDGNWAGRGDVPNWAVGTFYAPNPYDRSQITLTISNNGNVVANIGGTVTRGTMKGETLNMGGAFARVTRSNNGIVTTRTDNGERIAYSRSGNGGNYGPGWNDNGPRGDVPNWAVGTFYANNPQSGDTIVLTISSDGTVTVRLGNNNPQLEYGSMYRNQLTLNGATSNVSRIRNGIRTVRSDNGERIDYYRR